MRTGRWQAGVALALLLWMLAGLSLMVTGIMYTARTDMALTRVHLNQAKARAIALGAGHLLLRDLLDARDQDGFQASAQFSRSYEFAGMSIAARVIPSNGFVSLNSAPLELLANLLQFTGGLPEDEAQLLAQAIVDWREPVSEFDPEQGGNGPFQVLEELLRVPRMGRTTYDRVRDFVHVMPVGEDGIAGRFAPQEVLLAIADGDEGAVNAAINERRDTPEGEELPVPDIDSPFLVDEQSLTAFCLVVEVQVADNEAYKQRIWAEAATGPGGTPWRFLRVMPIEGRAPRVITGNDNAG